MKLPIINQQDSDHSSEKLQAYYSNEMIPAEKKTYLTNLKESTGPYMAVQAPNGEAHHFMDAASQIATLGLGFSPAVFMGSAHFLESWINNPLSENFKNIDKAFHNFLKRKTGFNELTLTYCHSGAEAVETAMGYCYSRRANPQANKVLAFESSFHGRMLVSLCSTWNKTKREPFQWEGYETEYSFVPEDPSGQLNHDFPKSWAEVWDQAPSRNFKIPEDWNNDPLIAAEVKSLKDVRKKLLSKKIFTIIIEPMQCEGGDRYLTNRFHSALLLMARSFKVPVINDEVQTGFHLGKEFFWHRELNLLGLNNERLFPDYVVCAKKAQVGLVLSHHSRNLQEQHQEFQVASVIRGYTHGLALDQAQSKIQSLEKKSSERLNSLVEKFSAYIESPRSNGLAFSFNFKDKDNIAKFIGKRFDHGLLYYPAGSHTLRFRLNTGFADKDLSFLFERLEAIANDVFLDKKSTLITEIETIPRSTANIYLWHENLIAQKLNKIKGIENSEDVFASLQNYFKENYQLDFIRINKTNFEDFKQDIEALQESIYEPTRQTSLDVFKTTAESEKSLCFALKNGNKLEGIAFSASLETNPLERGVRKDPYFNDSKCFYMIDTTIAKVLQGRGVGRFLRYSLYMVAHAEGVERIHGRNRDRLASQMLAINLSLGAHELMYLEEDYPDFEEYRDVFYYTSKLQWNIPTLNLTDLSYSPIGIDNLDEEYLTEQLPYLINKVCLSNFVSERFLDHMTFNFGLIHEDLRHGYSTSGQSECVDKIVKSLYFKQSENKRNKMLTFKGHYFGTGSFLSRSLSSNDDKFFPVTHLDHPNERNYKDLLEKMAVELESGQYLACWIEPIRQNYMDIVPRPFLKELKVLCNKYKTPLIYNETCSNFYKYEKNEFFASNSMDLTPDCTMTYLGGQAGQVFTRKELFLSNPLMLISTWDGDEFAFSNFYRAAKHVAENITKFHLTKQSFEKKLVNDIKKYQYKDISIKDGVGWFSGNFPTSFSSQFVFENNRYLVNPTLSTMNHYIKEGI
jgi:4-aminobutyrate aminotransferase-like enzyme